MSGNLEKGSDGFPSETMSSRDENHAPNLAIPDQQDLLQVGGADRPSKLLPSEAFLKSAMGRLVTSLYEGHDAPYRPDNARSDNFKDSDVGTVQCGRCKSILYCNEECLRSHWYVGGNEQERADAERRSEETAKDVLKNFKNQVKWHLLDNVGTYKVAIQQGLHDKIREVLEWDRDTLLERYRAGQQPLCNTRLVMLMLLRGDRDKGLDVQYSRIGSLRVKLFVRSHPNAIVTWMHASIQLLKACIDPDVVRNSTALSTLKKDAYDVWCLWKHLITNRVTARAILLPPAPAPKSTGADEARFAHVTTIVSIVCGALMLSRSLQQKTKLRMQIHAMAAMVHAALQHFNVPINGADNFMMTMEGTDLHQFRDWHVPMAKATFESGRALNGTEMCAVVERITQSLGR